MTAPSSSPRVDYPKYLPQAFRGLVAISEGLHRGSLPSELLDLTALRTSQLNGCVYCMDMHARALRDAGVPSRKLDTLPGWRESPCFDARERAALAWAEALTRLAPAVDDTAVYAAVTAHFDAQAIAELTFAIATINTWNRLCAGLRTPLADGDGTAGT